MDVYKVRSILNILFLILAVACVVIYFMGEFTLFIYVCSAALFIKMMEFFIRFTH